MSNKHLDPRIRGIWIPREILLLPDVTPLDMLQMGRVFVFDKNTSNESNATLAGMFNVHRQTLQRSVRRCSHQGYELNIGQSKHVRRLMLDQSLICEKAGLNRSLFKRHKPK